MLSYFRINDPYRLAGVFFILVSLSLPFFLDAPEVSAVELRSMVIGEKVQEGFTLYTQFIDSEAPLASWFHALMDLVFDRSLLARRIVALAIIFFQSAFIGIMFIEKKTFTESTYIPSFLFVLLFLFSYDTLALTSELLGSVFLLFALNRLYKEMEFREQRDENIFSVGLNLSLASLFDFSFVSHVIAALLILIFFTRSTLRKYLLMLTGFALPHLMLTAVYYMLDGVPALWQYYYLANLSLGANYFIGLKGMLVLGAIPLFYLLMALVMLNRDARLSKYQSQLVQSMFLWFIITIVQIFYSKEIRPQSFITLIPSFCFFFTHFLLLIRRKKFLEINGWILFVGIISVSYLARYGILPSTGYSRLTVSQSPNTAITNKRILVFDDNPAWFLYNTQATPFFNWALSRDILQAPGYYDHVVYVSKAFATDPPDVIVDRDDVMRNFFQFIPEVARHYRREDIYYYRQ